MGTHFWTPQTIGRVQLVDLDGNAVNPVPVINVSEGGVDTTGLAQESTQQDLVSQIEALRSESAQARPVTVENPEMPLPEGAATSAGQTQIVSKLNELYTLLGSQLSVVLENEGALDVAVASLPLPAGASTAQKQDTLLAAIQAGISVAVSNDINAAITSLPAVQLAANQSVSVGGTVNIGNFPATQPVSGSVNVGNFPATTRISGADTPLPVSANSPFPVTQSGSWNLAVSNFPESTQVSNFPPTQAVTQSGTWNFGAQDSSGARVNALTAEPAADARGLVTRNIPSGVQPVSGTVAATQSGAWSTAINNFPATQPVSLTTVPTHPVTQSGTWNVNSTMTSPTATAGALTNFRSTAVLAAPQAVKTSAGRLFNYHFANPNNSWVYVHLYNTLTANTTVGTTVPLVSLGVPANSVLDGAWMFSYNFSTAITIAVTTTATGTTAPATGLLADLGYV